jgi:hypothetical protein
MIVFRAFLGFPLTPTLSAEGEKGGAAITMCPVEKRFGFRLFSTQDLSEHS